MPDGNLPPIDDDDFNFNFDLDDDMDDWSKYEGVEFIRSTDLDEDVPKKEDVADIENIDTHPSMQPKSSRPLTSTAPKPKQTVKRRSDPRKKVKGKTQYPLYMGAIAALGAITCIGVFVLMFSLVREPSAKPNTTTVPDETASADMGDMGSALADLSDVRMVGLIRAANGKELTVIDVATEKEHLIIADGATAIQDEYGRALPITGIGVGDIANIAYNSVNNKAQTIDLNSGVWEVASVTGVKVDGDSIKIGNDYYTIPKNVVILNGPVNSIHNLSEGDTLTVRGYGDQVRTVIIENRHGYLKITNHNKIEDGFMEIGRDIYKALEEADVVSVPEGLHSVVISGANIDTVTKSVTIKPGETTELSLIDVDVRKGIVALRVNQTGYQVYVNDVEETNTTDPLALAYGVYKIRVEKEGFDSWSGDVRVNEPTVTVNVTLNKEVRMGKVTVASSPEGGSVYIDDAYFGLAPIKTDIEYGEHRLTVKMDGYNDSTNLIMVDGENREYRVVLFPKDTNSGADTSPGTGTVPDTTTGTGNYNTPPDTSTTGTGTVTDTTGTGTGTNDYYNPANYNSTTGTTLPGTDSGYTPIPPDVNIGDEAPIIP